MAKLNVYSWDHNPNSLLLIEWRKTNLDPVGYTEYPHVINGDFRMSVQRDLRIYLKINNKKLFATHLASITTNSNKHYNDILTQFYLVNQPMLFTPKELTTI